jgi:hypothetical protein
VTTQASLASLAEDRVPALLGFGPAGQVVVLAVGGERGRARCGGIVTPVEIHEDEPL